MNGSKCVVAVAPNCPAELVRELLGAGVLPGQALIDVLLPTSDPQPYAELIKDAALAGTTRILPSPGKSFFSPHHLYWLWETLRPSENNLLLVADSPYQDPLTAVIVLSVLALSGKAITLLFATPEAIIDLTGEGYSGRWLTQELNSSVLVGELGRVFWFLKPIHVLYFLMFWGLIARKTVSDYLTSRSKKPRPKKTPDRVPQP
jgi:hypothetical protein